jgi:hypothetical protein
MSTQDEYNSPAYWRQRAVDVHRTAANVVDPVAKQTLMEIAASYEELAAMAEKRPLSAPKSA